VRRFQVSIVLVFATFGLALASLGRTVIAFSVSQRHAKSEFA
jgi:hypothetical protein